MGTVDVDQNQLNQLIRIGEVFFQLAKKDKLTHVSPSHDACLLNEWLYINNLENRAPALGGFWRFVC